MANTLFIENVDHMGTFNALSTKRSGGDESNRIAYAYLMYRPDKFTEVSENA